jgi:hypothetical protein
MPIKLSRYNQTFFDIVLEGFGTLDNIVDVSNDNDVSISDQIATNTEFAINNDNLGDVLVKEVIINNGLEFNNNAGFIDLLTVDSDEYTADDTTITADGTTPPPAGVTGLLNFDGVDDYVEMSSTPDVTGSKFIEFNVYISSTESGSQSFVFKSSSLDFIRVNIQSGASASMGIMALYDGVTNGFNQYDNFASNYLDKISTIRINKTTGAITSATIDGNTLSINSSFPFIDFDNQAVIGRNSRNAGATISYFDANGACLLWNLNINNEHYWLGRPNGNLDQAWLDAITTCIAVPNSGATGTSDWINPASGIAENWAITTGEGENGVYVVEAASGFTGNVQRLETTASGYGSISSDLFTVTNGETYSISVKYRNGLVTPAQACFVTVYNSSDALLRSLTLPDNGMGVSTIISTSFVADDTDLYVKITNNALSLDGDYLQVDELKLVPDGSINGTVFGSPTTIDIN